VKPFVRSGKGDLYREALVFLRQEKYYDMLYKKQNLDWPGIDESPRRYCYVKPKVPQNTIQSGGCAALLRNA
jgi:hypothetical protein